MIQYQYQSVIISIRVVPPRHYSWTVFSLCCKVTRASSRFSSDKTPSDGHHLPSLIIGEHMLMQPLCSLHVLLLRQGQNWIAPGYCILPYAWFFGYIMCPHVCLLFISSCALVWKYTWIKNGKKKHNSTYLTFPLFSNSCHYLCLGNFQKTFQNETNTNGILHLKKLQLMECY